MSGRAVALAALASLSLLLAPTSASAYRRGLASSIGGATLGRGHVLWVAAGYPRSSIGWGVALVPIFDLGVHADVYYGSPYSLGESLVGGGGGVGGRVGLLRGRTSVAIRFGAAATVFSEWNGAAVLLDLGSPSAEVSFRLTDRFALHGSTRIVLQYVTRPSQFSAGFEARGGLTLALRAGLAMIVALSCGTTISNAQSPGAARFEALVGLEYRLGREHRSSP